MNSLARPLPAAARLRGIGVRRGIVKADELGLGDLAQSIVDDARVEAARTMEEARMQAATMIEEARAAMAREKEAVAEQAEQAVWREAAAYQSQYERRLALFTEALEEHALDVVRKAFTMLSAKLPAREKIQSTVCTLMSEAGQLPDCTLHVNAQDLEGLQASQEDIPWPLQADAALRPGECLLVAERGTWRASFEGSVQALLAAMHGEQGKELPVAGE
ncbi:HrpE/YscL family type III secretion apparatus protein [Noviherbaspirillum saxi]|nr:HrpE/YscL family type III secretion apparatus protein [Noviherbaspirillum saxi]